MLFHRISKVGMSFSLKFGKIAIFSVAERKKFGAVGILVGDVANALATSKNFDSDADSN